MPNTKIAVIDDIQALRESLSNVASEAPETVDELKGMLTGIRLKLDKPHEYIVLLHSERWTDIATFTILAESPEEAKQKAIREFLDSNGTEPSADDEGFDEDHDQKPETEESVYIDAIISGIGLKTHDI